MFDICCTCFAHSLCMQFYCSVRWERSLLPPHPCAWKVSLDWIACSDLRTQFRSYFCRMKHRIYFTDVNSKLSNVSDTSPPSLPPTFLYIYNITTLSSVKNHIQSTTTENLSKNFCTLVSSWKPSIVKGLDLLPSEKFLWKDSEFFLWRLFSCSSSSSCTWWNALPCTKKL